MVRTYSTEGRERLGESYANYPVMETCKAAMEADVKARGIEHEVVRDHDMDRSR